MKCQYCGNDKAVYIEEAMSSALCMECHEEFKSAPDPYDYPNERESYGDHESDNVAWKNCIDMAARYDNMTLVKFRTTCIERGKA